MSQGRTCSITEASSRAFSFSKNARSIRVIFFSKGMRSLAKAREWSIRIKSHSPSTSMFPALRSMFAMRLSKAL